MPLLHRGQLLGVLSLNGTADRLYSEHDLRAVSMFAEHAAIAVANARLYEAERALSAKLSHQVVHDPLTGVANRVLIADRLAHALARAPRTRLLTSVLFIDVDNFKLVNDEFGHDVGDQALSTIAKRISVCTRPGDTLGRFGGDEFIVVCEDMTDRAQAADMADRILAEFGRPVPTPSGERQLSVSIGVATSDPDGSVSADELIREADRAMYQAKMEGKARVATAPRRQPVHDQ